MMIIFGLVLETGLFKVESSLNDTFKVSSLNKEMNADLEANFNNFNNT